MEAVIIPTTITMSSNISGPQSSLPPAAEPALEYSLHPGARMAIVKYRLQPDFEEWSRTMQRLFRDPAYGRGFAILFDRRGVHHPASVTHVEQVVQFLDDRRADGTIRRWAVVVADLASFGMGRMAEQLTHWDDSNRAFRDTAEAEAWLLSA